MATKATVESRIISLYMCRGNHIHILNCKKTTTKGGSTLVFNTDCIIVRQNVNFDIPFSVMEKLPNVECMFKIKGDV